MLKKATLLLVCIGLNACFTPERNCIDFRTGTFTSEALLEGELVTTRFTRNKDLEIDEFKGIIDSFSVRWINDCEYIVKKLYPKNKSEEKAVHFKIIQTEGNTYTYEYGLVGDTKKLKGSAQKVQ